MSVGDGQSWDESKPDDSTVANQIDDYNRDLRVGVSARMRREHVWPVSQSATNEGGHHTFVTLQAQTAAPTLAGTTAGAVYIGASSAGYPLMFENSAGTAITVVNSAGKIAVVSGGTQGSIPICSSGNAASLVLLAGSADGLPLVTHAATAAPSWAALTGAAIAPAVITASHVTTIFGVLDTAKNVDTVYQATSDGFLVAFTPGAGSYEYKILSDSANPPTVVRAWDKNGSGCASSTVPIRKNDYWKVVQVTPTVTCHWMPFGV